MKKHIPMAIVLLAVVAGPAAMATAKNVDLVTLPNRDSVQLTIYNSEDITLVRETRSITLKKGSNKLQFSWAGTLIDPTSVHFRPLEHADEIELADTVFPGQKPQHLIWNIESKYEGQAKVEVSYFTSGLTWSMDYVATCDPKEEKIQFRGYVRVKNNSGEEYENAEIRLIVGTINLVEKIADLARPRDSNKPYEAGEKDITKEEAMRQVITEAEKVMSEDADLVELESRPRKIVKEGLSEYFMFAVEGTETIKTGWSKRMQAVKADDVKFDVVYRMRAHQYGPRPMRFFIWRNDDEHKLGDSPLPDGRVRLFRENGKDGLSYLGEQQVRYVPIKAEIEINLGTDDLVVYETRKMSTERLNFNFEWSGRQEYVTGWDEKCQWQDTIRNYHDKPIKFELRRVWNGHVDYSSEVKTTLFNYQTIETTIEVGKRAKKDYPCTVVTHFGTNSKQDKIELED